MADTPFMYWVGMNTEPATSTEELVRFNDFYSHTHMREVVEANQGFVRATRYELCEPDPRGDLGPRWLAVYEMQDEVAAQAYLTRNDGPPEGRPVYSPGPAACCCPSPPAPEPTGSTPRSTPRVCATTCAARSWTPPRTRSASAR